MIAVLCVGVGLFASGCEEDVVAVLDSERPFSLYGVITPQSETQRIRVFPIEGVLQPTQPEALDARLTSIDGTSGEMRTWRDTVFQDTDGQFAYAFLSSFRAEYGHTYRIEVERSDQAQTFVEVEVPPETNVMIDEPSTARVTQAIRIQGGAPRLLKVTVTYLVEYVIQGMSEAEGGLRALFVTLPYDDLTFKNDDEWVVRVDLAGDYGPVREEVVADSYRNTPNNPVSFDGLYGIRLRDIELDFIVANEEWNPPGEAFDEELLYQPETLSNVENGFGFVGAGYRRDISWLPNAEARGRAGFRVPEL